MGDCFVVENGKEQPFSLPRNDKEAEKFDIPGALKDTSYSHSPQYCEFRYNVGTLYLDL